MSPADADDARAELFERLGDLRAGMLGVVGSQAHMRPMSHYLDEDGAAIHFLTSRKTDLAREVGDGSTAHYCVVDDEDGFYACITGTAHAERETRRGSTRSGIPSPPRGSQGVTIRT